MRIRLVKLGLVVMVPVVVAVSTPTSLAYPPFLTRAEKYGAKDCSFCHARPSGGKKWNARGAWLMAEKERRKAAQVDVDWLKDYKPGRR